MNQKTPRSGPRQIARLDGAAALVEQAVSGRTGGRRRRRAALVAISGIDGSGKGTIAAALARQLRSRGLRVALIGLDPWHRHARERFGPQGASGPCAAACFYSRAFRFTDLFREVVDPLTRRGSLAATVTLLRPHAETWFRCRLAWSRVDVVLLEGIFLLKRPWLPRYDLALWVACSFRTALRRAIHRNQEGRSERALRRDYSRIYFPAQRLHFRRDRPRASASAILLNGDRGLRGLG